MAASARVVDALLQNVPAEWEECKRQSKFIAGLWRMMRSQVPAADILALVVRREVQSVDDLLDLADLRARSLDGRRGPDAALDLLVAAATFARACGSLVPWLKGVGEQREKYKAEDEEDEEDFGPNYKRIATEAADPPFLFDAAKVGELVSGLFGDEPQPALLLDTLKPVLFIDHLYVTMSDPEADEFTGLA
jgi:hypothetical protein